MAGTSLAIAAVACVTGTGLALATTAAAASYAQAAAAAADAAALAGADAYSGVFFGDPCVLAARIAEGNGFALEDCLIRAEDMTVAVAVSGRFAGFPVTARARAGPANEHGPQ